MGIISLNKASRLYWLGRYTERVYTGLKKAKPIYDAGVDGREGDYADYCFRLGIPGIMDAYRAGNVALLNAPGNGVADDKGIYYFVPKMIKYYLGEEPILHNAPTYLPFYEKDCQYVLEHLETLVVKDVAEAGGYGVVFGRDLTKQQLEEFRTTIRNEPRRFIAQEVIDFLDLPIMDGGEKVPRKADLRAFVLSNGDDTKVWASGLTRFSRNPDSFVVNSSQGGGFKDTWVLSR